MGVAPTTEAAPDRLTILHTNDWQSGLTGIGPDQTRGGVARLATLVDRLRAKHRGAGPVLLLDGGDVTMGTLYHTVTRETGSELQLMYRLGYDAVTLGNHEFDFRPSGLGQMIASATTGAGLPPLVATNLDLSNVHEDAAPLQQLYARGLLERTRLVTRGDLKVGFIGILGIDAQEVLAGRRVGISPPIEAARAAAAKLRADGADLVVVLSHSGVSNDGDGAWGGEEVELMRAVPEVDVIVGGHTHTILPEPILVDGRPVVQAGSDTQWLGELELAREADRWRVVQYKLHPIDDRILGRTDITAQIQTVKEEVDRRILAPLGYRFDQVVAEVEGKHGRGFDEHVIGNLVTDALRSATGAQIAFTGNGTLRADLFPGEQRVSDIFRISGLGVGVVEDSAGYPLVKCYLDGPSLKAVLEFLLVGYTLKGDSYYPRLSGLRAFYNPWRVPFDRIGRVELGSEAEGWTNIDLTDPSLRVSLTTTTYVATFLPQVSALSFGILDARILDADDQPVSVDDLTKILVDADPAIPGTQELKAWRALVDYVASRPDTDGDGVPNIPETGFAAKPRLIARASLAPSALWTNANWPMWAATAVAVLLALGLMALLRRLRKS